MVIFVPSFAAIAEDAEYFLIDSDIEITDTQGTVSDSTDDKKFTVPSTYYLTYVGEPPTGDYYRVSYNGLDCKVKKSDVDSRQTLDLTTPHYTTELSIGSGVSFIDIYPLPTTNSTRDFTFNVLNDPSLIYYGYMFDEDSAEIVWYYVGYTVGENNYKGYVLASVTDQPALITTIPDNPEYEEENISPSPSPSNEGNETPTDPSSNLLKVLLIIGISVPAVIVVALLFRPAGKKNSHYRRPAGRPYYDDYYDEYEEDYYDDYRDRRPPPRRGRY
jgi:hypothetical protein